MARITVKRLYDKLQAHYGSRNWWPAKTQFEVILGAILTQNTAWRNVESAIANLKSARLMTPQAVAKAPLTKLEKAVYPTGYYRQKALRVRDFSRYLVESYNGNLTKLFSQPMPGLRAELLTQKGIGPETADSIILYAGEKPVFVIDAYTRRLCQRLELCKTESYEQLQGFFQDALPVDVQLYNEYHALIVEFCKDFCARKPKCKLCFINKYCNYLR